ncbi:uncharacterized protein BP01DRAFT_90924 [Aspergillus saccharolyticus JOP 1030-1]|uniref:Uncharacterized protein n=1 Tax=Aspergillus saccharolyticus JOP 1030-1 TaxID=1450539 RepID=A0A318Z978_9EURO|nr:hypothetical protein BP01DRAFT_90924 [Aspergillus saccharolyticus JOP 1030-1]PYH43951.1 hypothetical protein BP01DRAFT_90924 [Aspergillus saccharolyticus JOP 1030-1]
MALSHSLCIYVAADNVCFVGFSRILGLSCWVWAGRFMRGGSLRPLHLRREDRVGSPLL